MIEGYRRRLGLMQQSDPYGRDYLSPVGQGDTPDIIATDPRLYPDPAPTADRNAGVLEQYMPQGLIDFGQSVNAARGKPSLFGKALGAIGLDAEGRRAATSWSDAAKSTLWLPVDMVQGLVDSGQNIHNYLYSGEGPSFHTSPDAADRARAERLTGDVFNVAGALPMASAGMSAAGAHAAGVRVAPVERAYTPAEVQALRDQAQAMRDRIALGKNTNAALEARIARQEARIEDLHREKNAYEGEIARYGAEDAPILTGTMGREARALMPAPGQDPVPGVTRMDGSPLYSNSKDAALPGLLSNTRDTVSSLAQAWGETPQQFMDRAVAGDASRSNMLMGALKGSGIDAAQIPGAVRDTYRGGQYSVAEAKQRIRDLDAEFGKLYVKHNNNEKAVLADPAYGPLNEEMKALTGGALPKEPSRFAQGFEALPSSRKFDLFSNNENAALPGLLRSAQAGEQLPMDTASRMKRAKEMGFNTDVTLYHGTPADVGAFSLENFGKNTATQGDVPAVFMTTSPKVAGGYAEGWGAIPREGANVMPLHAKTNNLDVWELGGGNLTPEVTRKALEEAKADGRSGVLFRNALDNHRAVAAGGEASRNAPHVVAMFDPADIRSKFAAFDPAQSHSPNLLASNPKESALVSALAGEQMQQPGITAYHGSPHDFDRFSMDKIGTGEGAQAYGHGLYFAENEGVAKQYREALTGNHAGDQFNPTVGGKAIDGDAAVRARTIINMGGPEAFIQRMQPSIERARAKVESASPVDEGLGISERDIAQMDLNALEDKVREAQGYIGKGLKLSPPGHLYEVRINADPSHFLDWDKPLSQQSGNARAFAEKDLAGYGTPGRDPLGMTGAEFYRGLEKPHEALRDAGIPGIKYLDQGSRTAGEGSRNFVVFDDKLISIVRKYGWAGAAAMLGMSTDDLMSQAQAQQPEKPDPYREALRMKARAKVLGLTP